MPNLSTWPMNQLAVRQAVSLAIDREDISKTGESGLEPVATNASGIVLPNFAADLAPAVKNATALPATANPKAADALLAKAGYTLKGGWFALKGKVVDITISDPSDYADYAEDDKLMVQDLEGGAHRRQFDGVSDTAWYASTRQPELRQSRPATGRTRRSRRTASIRAGSNSSLCQGHEQRRERRLRGSAEPDDRPRPADARRRDDDARPRSRRSAPIEEYVAKNLPVIPTVYGASFDEYNTAAFTGWPSASNPYEVGQPQQPTNEVVVLHLKPVS